MTSAVAPSFTEIFFKHLPYYLAVGMSWEQYWDDDCEIVKYYREADEIRRQRRNQELWLQGAYVYEAIGDMAPILHAFAKKNAKPTPYPSEPYAITSSEVREKKVKDKTAVYERTKAKVSAWAMAVNKRFGAKEVSSDGRHDG